MSSGEPSGEFQIQGLPVIMCYTESERALILQTYDNNNTLGDEEFAKF